MRKILVPIENITYDKIKISAELEKRSVTKYVQCLIETLFIYNGSIKTGVPVYTSYVKPDVTNIVRNKLEQISDIGTNELDGTSDSYTELHELGKNLKIENDAKPKLLQSSSYIFSNKITHHTRGWLYKHPNCTLEDYKKAFPEMF